MSFRRRHVTRSRALAVVGAIAVAALALTGCSSGGSTSSAAGGSATSGNITWWGWTPDQDVAERAITAFNKQYPKIHVTFKKIQDQTFAAALRPALASNDGPDVFNMLVGGSGAAASIYGVDAVDLTPAMKKLRGADWKKGLYPAGITDFTVKNRLVAAQVGKVAAGFLWINKDLFDKYKLNPPTTLAQWSKVCKTFRANGLGCFKEGVDAAGFEVDTLHSIADSVQPGWWTKATDGKAKWTDPQGVKMLSIWKQLNTEGILDPGALGIEQYPDANNAFLSGKAPMVQMGTWYRQYTEVASLKSALSAAGVPSSTKQITMVPIPFPDVAGKGNKPGLFGDPDYALAVNKKSKHVAAATTFALWLSSTKQGQQVIADNLDEDPVLESVSADVSKLPLVSDKVQAPYLQKLAAQGSNVTQPRLANISAALDQAIEDAATTVLGGQATPAQAAATLQAASGQ
jgi:raffinose/stachyose/melibiose transport system substrate-binding protein